ncbi:hypothetical protein ACTWQH_17665 [Streptomyces sp. 6N223]
MAVGAVALLTSAGCSSGSSGDSPNADGGAGQTLGANDDNEQEPRESQEPQEPVEQAGFDECGLFETEELAEIFGADTLYITGRFIYPQGDGGRMAGCSYLTKDIPGIDGFKMSTVAGTNQEAFFQSWEGYERGEVDDLGDHAEAFTLSDSSDSAHMGLLKVLDGDTGLNFQYSYSENDPGGMPALDEATLGQKMAEIAVLALERLPEEVTIPDGVPEGPCADIDLAQASGVLGEDLFAARTVLSDTGAMTCEFTGNSAALRAIVYTDPVLAGNMSVPSEDINAPEIGDGALVQINPESPLLEATVNAGGERVLSITGTYAQAAGAPDAPGPEDTELVQAIAEALAG